jgi:hypothetical protein
MRHRRAERRRQVGARLTADGGRPRPRATMRRQSRWPGGLPSGPESLRVALAVGWAGEEAHSSGAMRRLWAVWAAGSGWPSRVMRGETEPSQLSESASAAVTTAKAPSSSSPSSPPPPTHTHSLFFSHSLSLSPFPSGPSYLFCLCDLESPPPTHRLPLLAWSTEGNVSSITMSVG